MHLLFKEKISGTAPMLSVWLLDLLLLRLTGCLLSFSPLVLKLVSRDSKGSASSVKLFMITNTPPGFKPECPWSQKV